MLGRGRGGVGVGVGREGHTREEVCCVWDEYT